MSRWLATARAVTRDKRVPRWARWFILIGLLPIPGPFDELVLVVGVTVLVVRHRHVVVEHWRVTGLSALEPLDTWGAWA